MVFATTATMCHHPFTTNEACKRLFPLISCHDRTKLLPIRKTELSEGLKVLRLIQDVENPLAVRTA
jgi:hypothetical protein